MYFASPNRASGPEVIDLLVYTAPILPQNPLEKVGGFALHFFLFRCVLRRGGRLDPPKSTSSGPEALVCNLK
jgi:hypothetical protein